jgi:hypothetical protein
MIVASKNYQPIKTIAMKMIAFFVFLAAMISCDMDDNGNIDVTTGIVGNIKYGTGDCMPIIDGASRVYNPYNGNLYFIVKSDLANLGNGDFNQLKAKSLKTTVKDGKLSVELPLNTFVIMPEDVYLYSDYNTVDIKNEVVLQKDLKFWKCTSY